MYGHKPNSITIISNFLLARVLEMMKSSSISQFKFFASQLNNVQLK